MSLLNDALKAADQRQQRPSPSPYTGQGSSPSSTSGGVARVLAGTALVLVVGVGVYLYLATEKAPEVAGPATAVETVRLSIPAETPSVAGRKQVNASTAPAAKPEPESEDAVASIEPEAMAQLAMAQEDIPELPRSQKAPEPPAAEPVAVARAEEPEVAPKVGSTMELSNTTLEPTSAQPPEADSMASPHGANEVPAASAPVSESIKQIRLTPEQQDQSASKQIRSMVARGDVDGAESLLSNLTDLQAAPQSRYAFARGVLARGNVNRALEWTPATLSTSYPDLRLIRSRALLAGGSLDEAVTTLQSNVPPVASNVEYRVTLATLLQQQGQNDQAANHWAELIAWDDSQAPWWVGLAIALESRGDVPAARRAYQQAAALPGLAPSLADYVRQRLQTLGAG